MSKEEKGEVFALIPVGYGDGYHRLASNKGHVLIHGTKCFICGRVCMDQFIVRVPNQIKNQVKLNDSVCLLGSQYNEKENKIETIYAEHLSNWSQTINYEITTSLLNRAPKFYYL
jgi:alanine racemase